MKRLATILLFVLITGAGGWAGEIGYLEDFSLATDRTVPLAQLIPGTEDYFYYHALHYQNNGQYDQVEQLLKPWIKEHKYTARVREILNRQALLKYEHDPRASLEYIREQLGIRFDHQREILGQKPDLPTALDQKRIDRETLSQRAMARYRNLDGFENAALDRLAGQQLNAERQRHLLSRLKRPDYPNLAPLVVNDLNTKDSRGFGSLPIHNRMLLSQLQECLTLKPDLLNQTNFVNTYLTKLRPGNDVDWPRNRPAQQAYLDRLWTFAQRLAPVHNSLKAHVLYHRLVLDRSQDIYDRQRFLAYLQLPRNVSYINAEFMKLDDSRRYAADLNANYRQLTLLPPIGNDEPLVRSYLHHFFVDDQSYQAFAAYVDDLYLKHHFAETKIVHGRGDPQQWYAMLPAAKYQALKERIDLDFAHTNRPWFSRDDRVALDLDVKNVRTLIVKVFEINTHNFYRQQLAEVDTDINLDGLVANEEQTYTYDDPPLRRVRRHFEFSSLAKPGVYVIDFIGNGKSSRALVRKGSLHYLMRMSTAGHVFTLLDETGRHTVPNPTIYLAGQEYAAGDDGTITVPFSTNPQRQAIVLSGAGICSLDHFQHAAENYSLQAGIYVDREALLRRDTAKLVVRPALYVNGTPATLSVLEDVRLVLTSTDHDGVSTTKEVADFALFEDRESVYEFQVSPRLASIRFSLQAKVQNLSQNKKVDLSVEEAFALNEIDRSDKIEDLHFSLVNGVYVIDLLGKTGEPMPNRPVQLSIKHREFKNPVDTSLQTDRSGRIQLGTLRDIAWVVAVGPEHTTHTWNLLADGHTRRQTRHGKAGQSIEVPYMGAQGEPARDELSLLELRGDTFVADRFDALSIADGLLRLGDLPPGDYDLLFKRNGARIRVRLTEGDERDGYVLGYTRQLEVRGNRPLQIAAIETTADALIVHLQHASKFARLHVFATRYHPAYSAFRQLGQVTDPDPYVVVPSRSSSAFLAGRNIGDEYRYIIDRKYARKYPGNMLRRPGLLLNPWAIRTTEGGQQETEEAELLLAEEGGERSAMVRHGGGIAATDRNRDFANLDFLAQGSTVLVNLVPDDEGVVKIARADLGPHQHVHLVAVDPRNTVYRAVSLPEVKSDPRDLRLAAGLDPAAHFTQQKQVSVMKKGETFDLADITSSQFEAYDSLAKVYALYATINNDPNLIEFGFILQWHQMSDEEKRVKYSKYACHELSFFLHKKDPKFFQGVVQPYLRNKKDKTFVDHWLLEDDLQAYLQPWSHARLNIVEQILLAQRMAGEGNRTSRHVHDLLDLIPPNVERLNQLFDTALKSSVLDTDDRFGLAGAVTRVAPGLMLRPGEPPAKQPANFARRLRADDLFDAGAGAADPFGAPDNRPEAADDAFGDEPTEAPIEVMAEERSEKMVLEKLLKQKASLRRSDGKGDDYFARDGKKRADARQLYRKLDKTQEWVENNYYQLPIERQDPDLITVNAFWRDYADRDPARPFFSVNLAEASRSFPEMMFALALLDLPAEPGKHETAFDASRMALTAAGPMVVFHQEIKPAPPAAEKTPILVSQNFFNRADRYRYLSANEKVDKFITDEFLTHTVYGCQIVVTNPTSSRQELDVLLQMPVGAMPVLGGKFTRSLHVDLQPYHTQTAEYHFYFPLAGEFAHFPVQVAANERLVAYAEPFTFQVVDEPSKVDRESWDYISQHGTQKQVLAYLKEHNLHRINLNRIAFRMADKDFFQTVTRLLATRHMYNATLWSYGIKHNAVPAVRQYLQHADKFVGQCGDYIDSPLLSIDPVARLAYQHMEYSPLVNARAHQLGRRRQIVNARLSEQYHRLLKILSYRSALDDGDLMAVTYYLLLQDRIGEAIDFFDRVNPDKLATRLQHDYFTAYVDFFTEDQKRARKIADRYADYPVDRWRNAFAQMAAQLDEIEGHDAQVTDTEDRTQQQTKLAASQPSFDFRVESKQILVDFQNLGQVRVNYYLMDIELLFSQNPFVQKYSGQFSHIRPNSTQTVKLPAQQTSFTLPLPEKFHNSNVLVEMIGGGQTKSQAYYANSMAVQVIENFGQIRVTQAETGKPLPTVYVKVYARMKDGQVRFYKDGYTDRRGRFDYTSLNTNELDFAEKFSLLVLSDEHGAAVKEARVPGR